MTSPRLAFHHEEEPQLILFTKADSYLLTVRPFFHSLLIGTRHFDDGIVERGMFMPASATEADSLIQARQVQLRNFVELFRGGIVNIAPFFVGVRETLGKNADIAELRSLIASYATQHDDQGVIAACLMLKAGIGHRLMGEDAWYQEWHTFHDHLEEIFWTLPVKKDSGRPVVDGRRTEYMPILQDAKFWIAEQIALCWQLEKTDSSMRAFRFLMATFGAVAGTRYPTGSREYVVPEGYGHFNVGLIDRIRQRIIEVRVAEFRAHLPPSGNRVRFWEEWLEYRDLPTSVASLLNVEWARVMPARELADLRFLRKSRNGHSPNLP